MPFKYLPSKPLPQLPWLQAPLLRYVLFVAAGIVLSWSLRFSVGSECWLGILGIVGLLCLLGSLRLKGISYQRMALWVAPTVMLLSGATLTQLRFEQVRVVWPESTQMWQAQVKGIYRQNSQHAQPNAQGGKQSVQVQGAAQTDVVQADVKLIHNDARFNLKTIRLRLTGREASTLEVGTPLLFYARITEGYHAGNPGDFDYTSYLYIHGISGTASAHTHWQKLGQQATALSFVARLQRFRQYLVDYYATYFQGDELSILSALTLGDKSRLTAETRQLFSETGVSHVLALSGLHLGILFSLLNLFVLRWIRHRAVFLIANTLCIALLWLFVWMVGMPLSLLRAAWMFTLLQVGHSFQRGSGSTLSNLAFAALVLLIASPLSLFDVGFQLSFSAVLGIVLFNTYVWQRYPLPVWSDFDPVYGNIRHARRHGLSPHRVWRFYLIQHSYGFFRQVVYPFFTVSFSAQLGTLPFILYYFHQFSPYALLANVIVIPSAYLLLGGSLLFFLLPFDILRQGLSVLLHGVLQGMTAVLDSISHWPGATLTLYPHPLSLLALVAIPCVLYAIFQVRQRRLRKQCIYALTALCCVIIVSEAYRLRPGRINPQIIVYNVPRTTVIHFISCADKSYLYASTSPDTLAQRLAYIQRNFLAPNHIARPRVIRHAPFRDALIWAEQSHFVFGSHRFYVLRGSVPRSSSDTRYALHTLVVGYGSFESPATAFRVFSPRHVVLDASLPQRYREQWQKSCQRFGIPCHDVRTQGAFVYPIHE